MDPLMILWPPVLSLAIGGVVLLGALAWCWLVPVKEPKVTVNYDLTATCDDLPDLDEWQNYCPACLAKWHEYNPAVMGFVPTGGPALCEEHLRRLSQTYGLDPRAIAHGSVAWLLYGIRPQQGETR